MVDVFVRAATAGDQATIKRMIREAQLNPMGLHWPRFVVAERADGKIVGIGQIKILGDGTQELASLAVEPGHQGQRIGETILWTLLRRAQGPIYLRCASHNEGYYRRFGFRTLKPPEMPHDMRRTYRLITPFLRVFNRITGQNEYMLIMGQ